MVVGASVVVVVSSTRVVVVSGTVVVETRMPLVRHELRPGEHCHVPARKAHRVLNPGDAPARYLIVQAGAPYDYFPIAALDGKRT